MARTRKWPGAVAVAILSALLIGLGCSRPTDPNDEPEDLPPIDVPPEDLKALVEGNNQFAIDLYKQVAAKTDDNIILSPYSISSALAMTYAGARGQTAEEMRKVLHFTLPDDKLHAAFGALIADLQKDEQTRPFQLSVANALWGQQGYHFLKPFLRIGKRHYRAGLEEVDFGQTEQARQTINRWVAEQTRDKIKDLLSSSDLSPATRLVLTNAIYFKAAWATPFLKGETKEAPFHVSAHETITVPMMQTREADFRYLATEDCEWLELPYGQNRYGSRVSMIVILPSKGKLATVEQRLTSSAIKEAVQKLDIRCGKVSLPKCQVRMSAQLKKELSRLGMPIAFSGGADFSGMTSNRELCIDRVVLQACLNVDELGSNAAAATAAAMTLTSLPRPFSFTADRAFLFLIRDNETGSILFSGRVIRPGKEP